MNKQIYEEKFLVKVETGKKKFNGKFYCRLSDVKLNNSNPHHRPKLFFSQNRIFLIRGNED